MDKDRQIRIVIADDNNFFCEALKDSLDQHEEFNVLKAFTNLDNLVMYTQNAAFDVLVLDVNFNGESSLDYIEKIKTANSTFKIILLTSMNLGMVENKAFELGVDKVLGKDSALTDFKAIILNVFDLKRKGSFKAKVRINEDVVLTKRKLEILQALYDYSNFTEKQISEKLFISESALKTHKRELFEITQSRNTVELIKFGVEEGIIILNRV